MPFQLRQLPILPCDGMSYHITELAMALIHQSSTAPYIHNTVIVIKVARLR